MCIRDRIDSMKIVAIIPTLNEEQGIGNVIDKLKREGIKNIYVIDAHSTDRTVEIAKRREAKVIFQRGRGKGNAVRQALQEVNADIYIMVDGDDTYEIEAIRKMLEPVANDEADMVIGVRTKDNIPRFNRIGNWFFNLFLKSAYGHKINDVLSGFRVMNKRLVRNINLLHEGFQIETELTVEALENKFRVLEIPTKYMERKGKTKLNPILDGAKIFLTLITLFRDYRPLRFFWLLGFVFLLLGFITSFKVIISVITTGRLIFVGSAILAAFFFITAIQMFVTGLLADMIKMHFRRIRQIK